MATPGPEPQTVTGADWPGVRYFCTTRAGGVSNGGYASLNLGDHTGDDPAHVRENRARLRCLLPAEPLWLQQVHGIAVLDADLWHADDAIAQADAAVTTTPGVVLAVLTADCLPVVIADARARAVGVAHAGWRGLQGGVLEATLSMLRAKRPDAEGWRAWIGPGIGPQSFEVGADVFAAFVGADEGAAALFAPGAAPGKWMADLPGLALRRLRAAGVSQVQSSGCCTFAQDARFFSYRRTAQTGRMATCAWLESFVQDQSQGEKGAARRIATYPD